MSEFSYEYLPTATLTNDISPSKLQEQIGESSISTNILYIVRDTSIKDEYVITFESELSVSDKSTLDFIVAAHEHITTAESLKKYLDDVVNPFVENLMNTFAAENIAMGITQAGKTLDVLGLFEKKHDLGGLHPVSLKASFDTGSLYVSKDIIQYVRDNPSQYTGLSPFVTDARLLEMKNNIETFLELELST